MRRLMTANAVRIFSIVLPLAAWLAGCTEDTTTSGVVIDRAPTFHEDIQPLLQRSCQSCHAPGGLAPFELVTYESVKSVASLVALRTQDRSMPPWGALDTDDCRPPHGWKDDVRLSDEEIATIDKWVKAGTPEGAGASTPPPVPAGDELRDADMTIAPDAPYTPVGTIDILRCFVVDPHIAKDEYLNGTHFIAGNRRVVHHANAYLDATGESLAKYPSGEYDCFGGPNYKGAELLAAWTPGAVPSDYPPDVGQLVPAGSKIVLQLHYHPHPESTEPDLTRFQMRFSPSRPAYLARVVEIGDFSTQEANGDGLQPGPNDTGGVEFIIPVNAPDHTETMITTMPTDQGRILAVMPHMHYAGTGMRVLLDQGAAAPTCLVETPRWNLRWQRGYTYDAPFEALPALSAGDRLTLGCAYDNSLKNPILAQALTEEKLFVPQPMPLGEDTFSEMCLLALTLVEPNPLP